MSWKDRQGISDSQADALSRKERPFRRDHEQSLKVRGPETLQELKREFRDAYAAESPQTLQSNAGVEDGSALGTPRWSSGFRAFISGSAFARDKNDLTYVYPLRAALARMANDRRSSTSRNAAALLYLMQLHGDFDHVAAWRQLLGIFREDDFIQGTADPFTLEALKRWYRLYVQEPRRVVPIEMAYCASPTPLCPHGEAAAA